MAPGPDKRAQELGGEGAGAGSRQWSRLLCSAGEPFEPPRLHPCARLERIRSKGAGGSGKAMKA
eukprot:2411553-Pyramimonas_sp.AAC.1